jgi:hypothetical protein
MFVKKTIYYLFLLFLSFFFLGCKKAPNYSKVPSIQFDHLRVINDNVNYVDSVSIYINFQDGDGDLGNNPPNPNYLDYFVDIYKKTNGTFIRMTYFDATPLSYNGFLPFLSPDNLPGPIDGSIRYILAPFEAPLPIGSVPPPSAPFHKDDTLQFHVRIRDRAGNYSNWVETNDYIVWNKF